MMGAFAMKIASMAAMDPPTGFGLTVDIVRSPEATSYYTDAAALSNFPGWLGSYPEFLYWTGLHTQSKPPGPLLYWSAIIRLCGYNDRAAYLGAIGMGLLATLSIPATFWLVRTLTANPTSAFLSCATLSLCPGFVLFFPMFDPIYIVLSCGLIGFWWLAVTRDSVGYASLFGLVLALAAFISYPLLSLGSFLFVLGFIATDSPFAESVRSTLYHGMVALVVVVVCYAFLFALSGFDPIATFARAWHNQHLFLARHTSDRQFPHTIPWDLYDFVLGAAWIGALIGIIPAFRTDPDSRRLRMLIILCLAQPVLVACIGLIQTETARVWNFMFPLLLLPAGLELARWDTASRATFFACMWLLLAVIGQNMRFITIGP
jgi:hypothetical protein